jgi:transaldolase/glucose-6-phosphate isomerase
MVMARCSAAALEAVKPAAAETLRPVYDRLNGKDGYVSLEVSPYRAMKGPDTAEEAERVVEIMRGVPGVQQVVKVFEYIE